MSKTNTNPGVPQEAEPGARRAAILDAGLAVFMRYGFSRVTMDDIAREAGISRPTLYRDFRNKADIYAALADRLLSDAIDGAERALASTGALDARLLRAVEAGILDHVAEISRSPHGAEILDQKEKLTGDIIARWRGRMASALAAAIDAEARSRGVDLASRDLSAADLADTILDGLEGAKMRSNDPDVWHQTVRRLISLVMLALA